MIHTFVVCAYGNSPFLRACLNSLKQQTVRSRILIATSTPNKEISKTAGEYGLQVRVNRGKAGIAGDWNFALRQAGTPLVTLAHQDDIYEPEYAHQVIRAYKRSRDAIILFTDYRELREYREDDANLFDNGKTAGRTRWQVTESSLIRTKRLLLLPLRVRPLQKSRWTRRRVLSLGNVICCPSVTYVRERIPETLFTGAMKSNIDWQAWESLSREKGAFVYLPGPLMLHRIHGGSTTSELVKDNGRKAEDLYMFRKFWPGHIPELIWKVYGKNEQYQ